MHHMSCQSPELNSSLFFSTSGNFFFLSFFFFFFFLFVSIFFFFLRLVSSTTRYIHYKVTFFIQNLHSLSQELAPSREIELLIFSSLLPLFNRKKQKKTKTKNKKQPLCVLCVIICTTSRTSKQHYIFPNEKHLPEGTTRKLHCFFEGSVQLHVPKSTWLPGGPFWSLVSEQLRVSSFGIYDTANGLRPLSHMFCVFGSMRYY